MKNANTSRLGFTLIELLVVVLIIGILAAIALPQYQAAVLKSRFMAFMPLMRSLKEAQERYYMENGEYAASLLDLDVQIPGHCKNYLNYKNMWFCGNEWYIDNLMEYNKPTGSIIVTFCPGNTDQTRYSPCLNSAIATLRFYYDNQTSSQSPSLAGKTTCTGNTPLGKKMCKTFLQN